MIESFSIDDPISNSLKDCIEVTIKLKGHRRRWCFFVTSEWVNEYLSRRQEFKAIDKGGITMNQLTVLGNIVDKDCVEPFDIIAVPHMIIVKEISKEIIENTLKYLDENNQILKSTIIL